MGWKMLMSGVFEGDPNYNEDDSDITFLVKLSNIPPTTAQTHRFFTFQLNEGVRDAFEAVIQFPSPAPFLTLLGPPGTGKTHLALAVGWSFLKRHQTVLYYHAAGLLNALRDGYKHSSETDYEHTLAFAKNCSLLILDDFGVQKETDWANEQLDFIIDSRYENQKPLIVTTNLALSLLPARISDRLSEGALIQLKGESFRKKWRGVLLGDFEGLVSK